MSTTSPYSGRYARLRRMMAQSPPVLCAHCKRAAATTLDHDPPLAMHRHVEGSHCCRLIPSCEACNREGGRLVQAGYWRPGVEPVGLAVEPERDGIPIEDPRWSVSWLRALRKLPDNATWPRLMTVPHPRAVDSLGPEFVAWAERRTGRELRWWQRLVATRLLEVDVDGKLVWETLVLSTARQVGKSWLLRELCLWRIEQGDRFGEPQDVMHTGKDIAVCKEIQRPARLWARLQGDVYRVTEVNGQECITFEADGSRWMIRAKGSVYGYSVGMGVVDEGWDVDHRIVEEGLTPTMVEREQPQLLLVSTAHRKATALMLGARATALAALDEGDGDLMVEWSAPRESALDDVVGWRLASPHWGPGRERLIGKRLDALRSGDYLDPDEPDPESSFRAQWLNQWPQAVTDAIGKDEPLLPSGSWAHLAESGLTSTGPLFVALEDDYGLGAAVAAACRLDDGRIEVDGWLCPDWDSAVADARRLGEARRVRELLVGASLIDRLPPDTTPKPQAVGGTATRVGLSLLRDLAQGRVLTHEPTTFDLDDALAVAQVREAPTGLYLTARGPTHLVKALVWAVGAAHRPVPTPAIF